MVLARAASASKGLGRTVFRRAGSSTRNRSYRQIGRRGYASDHGHGQQQSSEIPWIIGSAAVTIPAAAWLWQQGPKKSEHGHDSHHGKEEEKADEEEEQPQEESKDEEEPKDESKDDGKDEGQDEDKDDSKEDSKSKDKDEDKDQGEEKEEGGDDKSKSDDSDKEKSGDDKSKDDKSKGPGEGQKGDRAPTEKKGEKDSQGDHSGAKHPYIDDPEKSKKGVGVTETARIHGTVDPREGARGAKESGKSSS